MTLVDIIPMPRATLRLMQAGRPSDTATYVAMGRALAHARRPLREFSDPFALQLLPPDCAATVERILRGGLARSPRDLRLGLIAEAMVKLMASRTVEIDGGVRAMPAGSQVVIVGAGLDSRAYRLQELSGSVFFEVDHPATQAFKRDRAAGLRPRVRELRHVAVDLSREPLAPALERAGHSTGVPTAWVFEGVISYLTRAEVESSIEAMASRSAVGSRLIATYNEPRRSRKLLTAAFIARTGEPHRAVGSFAAGVDEGAARRKRLRGPLRPRRPRAHRARGRAALAARTVHRAPPPRRHRRADGGLAEKGGRRAAALTSPIASILSGDGWRSSRPGTCGPELWRPASR